MNELIANFNDYTTLSTRKRAGGMSVPHRRTLSCYMNKFVASGKGTDFHSLVSFLSHLDISQASKYYIACSLGKFFVYMRYISKDDFNELRGLFKSKQKGWSSSVLTKEDVEGIITYCLDKNNYLGKRNAFMCSMFALTACRLSELTALKMSSVREDNDMLYFDMVTAKQSDFNNKYVPAKIIPKRTVIAGHLFGVVAADYLSYRSGTDFVFTSRNGYPMSDSAVYKTIKQLGKEVGLPALHPHSFRHFRINEIVIHEGVGVANMVAGHASLSTTLRYVNPEQQNLSEVFGRF